MCIMQRCCDLLFARTYSFPLATISSLPPSYFDGSDSLEKQDEKSPLLSAHGGDGAQGEDIKEVEEKPERKKDFQTIRVPGSGGTPVSHDYPEIHS